MTVTTFSRFNPITNEIASSAKAMTVAEALAVADKAAIAFPAWAEKGPNFRRAALFAAAGLPEGLIGVVTNSPESAGDVVGALIDHPAIKRINFTGSTKVGRIVAVRAAQNLKPCLLELGGKAPLIVLEDANLEEAVKA